ncbi:MAG: peptide ABC transporter substrate-binding protein [Ardenticatenaceae bacterium]|nr:peptide ABC transporter substrate-binding protein [Ardenticatenaceae bacterium]
MFTHQFIKRWSLLAIIPLLGVAVLAACQPTTNTVEVTRIVNEIVTEAGEQVEVTRVVTETVVVTPEVTEAPAQPKDLIVCMAQEPDTLYPYGGSMLAASAVQVAIFETEVTTFSYDYQPLGIEKLPSLADGDAVVGQVEVNEGDLVLDATGNPATLTAGVSVINSDGETVEFDGTPITMEQISAEFTLQPRVWSDGVAVTAADSVYTYELNRDPDTPAGKFLADRTASYEATGELGLEWTGIPGFLDPTYFTNVWQPFPQHIWGQFTASELLEAEESTRLPVSDGAFHIVDWIAGDSIILEPNPYYYRQDEGLPYLDSVTFKFIPDTNQLIAQLISGACDIGTQDGLSASDAPFLIEAENNGLLTPYFQTGTVFEHIDFGINSYGDFGDDQGRPDWFEDARVRQAMTMCTDRQGMVDNILYGRSEVIHSYVPSVHPLYPEDGLTEWPYDVEAANALLDEVGFIDTDGDGIREYYTDQGTAWEGEPFSVDLGTTTGNDMRQQMTQIFKANMLDCGIDITLYYVPSSEWFADGPDGPLFGRRFDLGEFAWISAVQPSCNLYLTSQITGPEEEGFGGWGASNDTGWSNEAFDLACNTALSSLPGTPEYEESHKEAQRIFSQEVPVIPAFLRLIVAAARPNVVGFGVDPTGGTEMQNIYQFDLQQ